MIVAHIPTYRGLTPNLPDSAGRHLGKVGALHSMVCIDGLLVDALLWHIWTPRRTTSKATSITNRGRAWCAPWIVPVNVIEGKGRDIACQTAAPSSGTSG